MSFGVFELRPFDITNVSAAVTSEKDSTLGAALDLVTSPLQKHASSDIREVPGDEHNDNDTTETPAESQVKNTYTFLHTTNPYEDLQSPNHRRTIRSQAARLEPLKSADAAASKPKRRRRRQKERNVTFHLDLKVTVGTSPAAEDDEQLPTTEEPQQQVDGPVPMNDQQPVDSSVPMSLDGGWGAFSKLCRKSKMLAPGLVDHCTFAHLSRTLTAHN